MPIHAQGSPDEKLAEGRRLFERTVDVWNRWFDKIRKDFEFHSGGDRQWDPQDVAVLRKQLRPMLTFNLIRTVINELVGAMSDAKHEAKAVPVGEEDSMRAEVFNLLWQRVRRMTDADFVDSETFEMGTIGGIAHAIVDANPDPSNPARVRFCIDPVHPFEVLWDPASSRRDLRDAEYVFIQKWVRVAQFKESYPHLAQRADAFMEYLRLQQGLSRHEISTDQASSIGDVVLSQQLPGPISDDLYFDRRQRRIKVIHLEYRRPKRRYWAIDPRSREPQEISASNYRRLRSIPELSAQFPTTETWDEEVRWLEFTGIDVLFDDVGPTNKRRFTLQTFCCDRDKVTGEPVGVVRDLLDPQREINKRHSQTLHLINRQASPGVLAEADAFVDDLQAEASLRGGSVVTKVKANALAQGKILPIEPPRFPQATSEMMDKALEMFFRISGVHLDSLIGPSSAAEPATTALLRYRRSIMSITRILDNFRAYKKFCLTGVIDLFAEVVPDAQVEAMLGDPRKWQVRDRTVTNLQTGETMALKTQDPSEWNVDSDISAANTTINLLQLQIMLQMAQLGVPMDGEVLVEQLPIAEDTKLRLKRFIRAIREMKAKGEQQRNAALGQMAQVETARGQLEAQAKVGGEVEKHRHNVALETIQSLKNEQAFLTRLADIYERTEEGQRGRLFEILREIVQLASAQEEKRQVEFESQLGAPATAPGLTAGTAAPTPAQAPAPAAGAPA